MPNTAPFVHVVPCSENTIPPDVCQADLSFSEVKSPDPGAYPGADRSGFKQMPAVILGPVGHFSGPCSFIQAAERNK